ncbi:MAG: glycosyltransferase family 2 protein [Planctomycetota bacterium]|nr:glycosyltransferase family 2 protein [Planctomycetota bacterium]
MSFKRKIQEQLRKVMPSRLAPSADLSPGGASLLDTTPLCPGPPLVDEDLPRATIVILNYNGRHHLEGCFGSLAELDYPREKLEIIMIDNGSSDDSVDLARSDYAWVRTIVNERNVGFSAGCNQGALAATKADVLVFLNNDMRVREDWLRELVGPVVREECAASTAKMFSWDGKVLNSTGGGMNFHGIGIQKGYLQKPTKAHDVPARTLFACGGAMAIDAAIFHDVGGFDEDFFAYYEDVDLGWRLWVMGHEIHYQPRAVCWHHHSSTSRTFPTETIRLLQVRNPFFACFKNYDDETLRKVLPAQLALAIRRTLIASGIEDDSPFRIEKVDPSISGVVGRLWDKARRSAADDYPLRREAVADLVGIGDLLGNWDLWMSRREAVQARRKRSDKEIFQLFSRPLWCIEEDASYRELHEGTVRFFGLDKVFHGLTSDDKKLNK